MKVWQESIFWKILLLWIFFCQHWRIDLQWQILWICLILQSEFSRGGGQNKRRSYIFVFSDSNDLNCQNKTFMCTVKEHRHVSQQNRITSKTNKIPLNLCSYNSINSIFKLMSTFFYKDYRIITMYIYKKNVWRFMVVHNIQR